jgi:hypothetical protein
MVRIIYWDVIFGQTLDLIAQKCFVAGFKFF